MTDAELRITYMRWFRRAAAVLVLPLVLTALLQLATASPWWDLQAPAGAGARYLFIGVAIATAVAGRDVRKRETEDGPLESAALVSLSWRLLVYAMAPVVIGTVLAFMTRQMWDFYMLLGATLIALVLLFPRYEQWVTWSARPDNGTDAGGNA